jgi:hypothetical protein
MTIHGDLIPRRDATPEQLKALGAAIQAWFSGILRQRAEAGDEADGWLDEDAVADLLHGELPQPMAARCLPLLHGMTVRELIDSLSGARDSYPLARHLLPPPHARCVGFGFVLAEEGRDDLLASMRARLPLHLIAEIRIDGERYELRR